MVFCHSLYFLYRFLPLTFLSLSLYCLLSFPFTLSLLLPPVLRPPCCPLSLAIVIRSRALRQMIQTVTSVLGSPQPPLLPATLPLTPTHMRPWLTPPLLWGKGRYSCMTVTMKECFRPSGFYRRNVIGSFWG